MTVNEYRIVRMSYECISSMELVGIEELAERSRIQCEVIQSMIDWDLLEPVETDPRPIFNVAVIPRLWRIIRLKEELGSNWNGIGVILDLLEKIDKLEKEISRLKKINP